MNTYQDRPVADKPVLPIPLAMTALSEMVTSLEGAINHHRARLSPVLNHSVTEGTCEDGKSQTKCTDDRLSVGLEYLIKRVSIAVDAINSIDDRLEI